MSFSFDRLYKLHETKKFTANVFDDIMSPLYRNSFYLFGSHALSAIFGYVFWVIAAQATSADDIGIVQAMLGSILLLTALADLGITPALIYYIPHSESPDKLLNMTVRMGWLFSMGAGIFFLLGLSIWSPGLIIVRDEFIVIVIFVAFLTLNFSLGLLDIAMLHQELGSYVFWRNLACNVSPVFLLLLVLHRGVDYKLLFIVFTLPNIVVGILAGTLVIPRYFVTYRFWGIFNRRILLRMWRYGTANYISNMLWGIPSLLIPIITINTLSAMATGYFLMNWTVYNVALIVPKAVSTSLFIEGAKAQDNVAAIAIRSLRLAFVTQFPIISILWLFGGKIVGMFGHDYVDMAVLRLLLIAIIPFTINSFYFVILRIQGHLLAIIIYNIFLVCSVIGFVLLFVLSASDARGIALGWLTGHSLLALFVLLATIFRRFNHLATRL